MARHDSKAVLRRGKVGFAPEGLERRLALDVSAFGPLVEVGPRGAMVFGGEVAGEIAAAVEIDDFSLVVDGGQTISVRVRPLDGQDVTLRLRDGGGAVDVARDLAGVGGIESVSSLLVGTGGEWTLSVGGDVGRYELAVVLNAGWEAETFGGVSNGTPESAQDLDGTFAALPGSGARVAVAGGSSAVEQVVAADDFESGALSASWSTYTSASAGRVRVTTEMAAGGEYSLVLDRENMGSDTLTEAIWTVDLAGLSSQRLLFQMADFRDETDPLPDVFTGHRNGDGVAISADGVTWHTVISAPNQADGVWEERAIDLVAAADEADIPLGDLRIKFQQFDNNSTPSDGRGFDEMRITAVGAADEDWYRFTLADGESAAILADGVQVELYDAASQLLAGGGAGGQAGSASYRDTTSDGDRDVYYVRAVDGAGDYRLVVLRDAMVEVESSAPQSIGAPDGRGTAVLGRVDAAGGGFSTVEHVVHISVDGLRGDFLQSRVAARPADFPNFARLQNEGARTYNARTDYTHTVTLPNHTSMITGRPVFQPAGQPDTVHHGWVVNDAGSIEPTDTLHNQGNPNVPYIASTFDVAHDYGLSTALYASKEKFIIYEQSYNDTAGAVDTVGEDDGRDKIDVYVFDETDDKAAVLVGGDGDAIAGFAADLAERNFNYSFVHLRDPDSAGHRYGWGTTQWDDAIRAVDGYLGQIFAVLDADPELAGKTALILTTDHGGGVPLTSHGTASAVENYTIPVFVWGAGLTAGADLYDLFTADRLDPGTSRPDYNAAAQPFRNGETGNLALALLGLPPIPGSTIRAPAIDHADSFSVEASAGDMLMIETATPADGPGEFGNTLDPVIELLDPSATVVGEDDNSAADGRNARLAHTAAMSGVYTVRVRSAGGSAGGAYILSVRGATGSGPMAGDFDQDGVVGLGDLAVLQASMGLTSSSVDLSGDGVVNLADAAIWTRDFGRTSAGLSPPTPDEPAALAGEIVGRTPSGLRATRLRPPHSPREDRLDGAAVDSLMTSVVRRGRHNH